MWRSGRTTLLSVITVSCVAIGLAIGYALGEWIHLTFVVLGVLTTRLLQGFLVRQTYLASVR